MSSVSGTGAVEALAALLAARARGYASAQGAPDVSDLSRFVGAHSQALATGLAAAAPAASDLAAELAQALQRRQQFARVDTSLQGKLERVFAHSIAELRAALIEKSPDDLTGALARIFEGEARKVQALLAEMLGAGASVCAEYSVELQLDLLGVSPSTLREPILDLGCGQQAELVRYLRAEGRIAFGLDRHGQGPDVVRADWLEHAFASGSYGTILSHQAFSLHFLHHHLGTEGARAEAYARKYMELLAALEPGGSFIYAPGLPFMEQHLPAANFRVKRAALPSPLREAVDSVFSARVGAVAYACRVTRR